VFDIIGKRRWYFLFSALITIPGLIFILLTPITAGAAGLQFTIDYTGGTKWELAFEDPTVTAEQVEQVFADNGLEASVVVTSDGFFEIKTEPIGLRAPAPSPTPAPTAAPGGSPAASGSPDASPSPTPSPSPSSTPAPSGSPSTSASPAASPGTSPGPSPSAGTGREELPSDGQLGEMVTALEAALGPISSQGSLTTIGPVVSSELINQALILILVGALGIVGWITYRFRDVKFGFTALASLLHDVLVVIGTFAILGTFFHVEIDALFVTAMLTVIGFSVHDTIVVYDRVRENRARHAGEPFDEIVNHSILQTIGRSITTSMTVVITLLALLLFGGAAINNFIIALLIGIVSGTYSSIFVAAPLLVDWHLWEDRRHGRAAAARGPRVRRATP
jgi:preprotein translocase subunit SecF